MQFTYVQVSNKKRLLALLLRKFLKTLIYLYTVYLNCLGLIQKFHHHSALVGPFEVSSLVRARIVQFNSRFIVLVSRSVICFIFYITLIWYWFESYTEPAAFNGFTRTPSPPIGSVADC